jgi:hypothetical protein
VYRKTQSLSLLLALLACTKSSDKRYEAEPITRRAAPVQYVLPIPSLVQSAPTYPWDNRLVGKFPRITREFFRCRGSSSNAPLTITRGETAEVLLDCEGGHRHSLPVHDGREEIYPILIDLLNYLQARSGHRVVITCGHRCPKHNVYADASTFNATSKHQIGAEVDFYLEDLEQEPLRVVQWIFEYYGDQSEFGSFARYEKSDTNVTTPPWYNQEILVKLFTASEGRDLDNTHPYPYLSIQVRYDRQRRMRVSYSWDEAFYGFWREG